jgi:hypothetical protein
MRPEQRKNPRFLVQDGVIAALRDGFIKIGKVKDISIGGCLSSIYRMKLRISLERNIFLLVNEFCLPKVPCKVVYDIPVQTPDEYQAFPIQFITRRCGVKFERLSEDQEAQLGIFFKAYTKGKAP